MSGQTATHWAADSGHDDVLQTIAGLIYSFIKRTLFPFLSHPDCDVASLAESDERESSALDIAASKEREQTAAMIERLLAQDYVSVEVSVEAVIDSGSK